MQHLQELSQDTAQDLTTCSSNLVTTLLLLHNPRAIQQALRGREYGAQSRKLHLQLLPLHRTCLHKVALGLLLSSSSLRRPNQVFMVVVRQWLLWAVTMVVQWAHTLPLAHRLHILRREQTPQQQRITLQLDMVGMAHHNSSSKRQLVVRVRRVHSTPSVPGRSATPHTNGGEGGVFAVSISLVALAVDDAARSPLLFVYSPNFESGSSLTCALPVPTPTPCFIDRTARRSIPCNCRL
jgi:hypothetical protein